MIGLDGLDPRIVSRLIEAGHLPNLAKLAGQGGFSRVATTRPAQTPVAWSTFATGVNPGGHGIFDFIRRNPKNYLPELALNQYEQKSAFLPPKVVNLRRGKPMWEMLSAAGVPSTILRCPCTYPPDSLKGEMLSGMGVPDVRGGLGTTTYYTTRTDARPRESENVVKLQPAGDGVFNAHLIGPRNPKDGGDTRVEITVRIDPNGQHVVIASDGAPRELKVNLGAWSEWLRAKFKLGMLQSIRGMVRFLLVSITPDVVLYASPVNYDPAGPPFPISEPFEYANELAKRIGLFHTTGMVEEHTGLTNERIPESAYLDQCEIAWAEREAMLRDAFETFDRGLLYCLFDTPDRIQHLFWRFREPSHPANRGNPPDPAFADVIDDCYRRCDRIVGSVLDQCDGDTLLIALSDHGFTSFQRGVNLNTWLHANGLLTLENGVEPGESAGDLLRHVDWSRTKAYALGLSGIYLNIKGREERGIIPPDEADSVKSAINASLAGLTDSERGDAVAIRQTHSRETIYHGPYTAEAPDILVDFAEGYRVSWSSSLGGISERTIEDNTKKWSGDHIVDPTQVPGMLFMNRPFRPDGARLLDLAPTILAALGVPKGSAMEGDSLLP